MGSVCKNKLDGEQGDLLEYSNTNTVPSIFKMAESKNPMKDLAIDKLVISQSEFISHHMALCW